ncbi:hypothetical protein [Achromobacter sp.]|uniref:hypothetical protein n=1 Tax=Achromobacter sp. TaxID=134375 RepID=UPI0028A82DF1|nr:hypothetical protein [Achromobacter sp.]
MKLPVVFSACVLFGLSHLASASPAFTESARLLLQAMNRSQAECLHGLGEASCERSREVSHQLTAAGWTDEEAGLRQLVDFCSARAFIYQDATADRQAGTRREDAKIPRPMAPRLQVPSEIQSRIYDQVYTRHEFQSLKPSKVFDAVMATCGFGSTFGAGDHVSVAKSIWGEDEINRWLAGEAPDKDARRGTVGVATAESLRRRCHADGYERGPSRNSSVKRRRREAFICGPPSVLPTTSIAGGVPASR